MSLRKDIAYSGRTLLASKSRTFLTMLGIIIGVMSVVAVSSVGKSAQNLILEQTEAIGTNVIGIVPGGSGENEPPPIVMGISTNTFKESDYRALRALPHVILGAPLVLALESASLGQIAEMATIYGTGEEFPGMMDMTVAEGRFFSVDDVVNYGRVVVLGANAANDLSPRGSPLGKQIRIKGYNYLVIGILKGKGGGSLGNMDTSLFIPVTAVQKYIAGIEHLTAARVKVDNASNLDWVRQEIVKTMRRRHHITDPAKDDFSVRSAQQAITTIAGITDSINYFLLFVTAISLLVGGINIMNIMYVAVRERTREIGLRKSLGAKPGRILRQFLTESAMIALSGGVIGLILGAGIAGLVSMLAVGNGLTWHFTISMVSVVVSLAVSIGIGLAFGVGPAAAAAKLDAIEAMRYE